MIEVLTIARRHAGQAAREADAEFSIVLIAKDDALVVGAWCPDTEVIKDLLRQALHQMDAGAATHVTVATTESEPS